MFGLTVISFNLRFLLIVKAMLRAQLWVTQPGAAYPVTVLINILWHCTSLELFLITNHSIRKMALWFLMVLIILYWDIVMNS